MESENKNPSIPYHLFDDSIKLLRLSKPALRALATVNAFNLDVVRNMGKERVNELHGIGKHAIQRLFP